MTREHIGILIGAAGLIVTLFVSIPLGVIMLFVGVLVARWGDMESPFRPR